MQKYFLSPTPSCPQGAWSRPGPGRPRAWHGLVHAARGCSHHPAARTWGWGVGSGRGFGGGLHRGPHIHAARAALRPPSWALGRLWGVPGSGAAAPGSAVGARKVSEKRPHGVESCRASLRFPPALTSRVQSRQAPTREHPAPSSGGGTGPTPPHHHHPWSWRGAPGAAPGAGVPLTPLFLLPDLHPPCTLASGTPAPTLHPAALHPSSPAPSLHRATHTHSAPGPAAPLHPPCTHRAPSERAVHPPCTL